MNISEISPFQGLEDYPVPSEMQPVIHEIVRRIDSLKREIVFQLRSEPTVFHADPDTEPDKILGWKAGDLAIWVDGAGVSQFRVLE